MSNLLTGSGIRGGASGVRCRGADNRGRMRRPRRLMAFIKSRPAHSEPRIPSRNQPPKTYTTPTLQRYYWYIYIKKTKKNIRNKYYF